MWQLFSILIIAGSPDKELPAVQNDRTPASGKQSAGAISICLKKMEDFRAIRARAKRKGDRPESGSCCRICRAWSMNVSGHYKASGNGETCAMCAGFNNIGTAYYKLVPYQLERETY